MASLEILTGPTYRQNCEAGSSLDCRKCGQSFPLSEFYRDSRYSGGVNPRCRSCKAADARAYHHRYHEQNKARLRDRARARVEQMTDAERKQLRRKARLSSHGVSVEWYESVLARQGGGCSICGTLTPHAKHPSFYVDHDHNCCPGSTGCAICVRGLLCDDCNVALGRFKDSPELLSNAIRYLEAHSGDSL